MADYFSEYSSFIGAKGLPSPADTPYETPSYIRSKRSSRATTVDSRSREQSSSPPPLPQDAQGFSDKNREGRYSALDPRRFTPTLHASLVSEILNLRRELDSKNNLMENLETNLASVKSENETLTGKLSSTAREVRSAKQQVKQMENGTYEALESMVIERDRAQATAEEMRSKLDAAQKKQRAQDDDAGRTQIIWEREKEGWENERRQFERRIHVTETRLRVFVDEMAAQQVSTEEHTTDIDGLGDESMFKDSGIGNESDSASVYSKVGRHRRNVSSLSYRSRDFRNSIPGRNTIETPEPHAKAAGYSLADELGIDEEDEYDMDDFEHGDDELEYSDRLRRTMESRQSTVNGDIDSKAKRVLGLSDSAPSSPAKKELTKDLQQDVAMLPPVLEDTTSANQMLNEAPVVKHRYVDTGYQPSPPQTPPRIVRDTAPTTQAEPVATSSVIDTDLLTPSQTTSRQQLVTVSTKVAGSPISPPDTPIGDGMIWPENKRMSISAPAYSDSATQTEVERPQSNKQPITRDSLQLPQVPSIAIHPPSSRPASPRSYVLPPGTKNATTQVSLVWQCKDASMQTEEIRVDKRPVKLPAHLLPSYIQESRVPSATHPEREATNGSAKIFTVPPPPPTTSPPSPPVQSATTGPAGDPTQQSSNKDQRSAPLKAIPLPKPMLAPAFKPEQSAQGPLNRSVLFGVSHQNKDTRQLVDMDNASDVSDYDDDEPHDLSGSIPVLARPAFGRCQPSEHPKIVHEGKEISPGRRPETSDSFDAAPAPSISSSRGNSRIGKRPPPKLNTYMSARSRSPSFGSVASSSYSTHSALPPYPIPTRSSSRVLPGSMSEGSHSPTPESFSTRSYRSSRGGGHVRQSSLRKVQSAAAIRQNARRISPTKPRRRLRSPNLTPVQSMAFESPARTNFPIPDLPTPIQQGLSLEAKNGGSVSSRPPGTANSSLPPHEESPLVEAIAATMVGEWMWKYTRMGKSMGGSEAAEDFPQMAEDGSVNTTTRHKRWVWLSPYERTIMWDSKQPNSGTALLGKKGRKLVIQSVLDVQDDNPLPKRPELNSAFHRSILILTPKRALKFTTTNAERHSLWMTALSFLAESTRMQTQLPPLPLVPPMPAQQPQATKHTRQDLPSFGRAKIRDSVRLTQGRQPNLLRSVSAQQPDLHHSLSEAADSNDGADFPAIPRLYSSTTRHQRKRSNTSPRLPPALSNLRSFSSGAVSSSTPSGLYVPSSNSSKPPTVLSASSQSGSYRGSITSPVQANFFEAVGTVRMEAFVDPSVRNGVTYVPAPPPTGPMHRRHRGDSNLSSFTLDKRRAGYVFDEDGVDPFKGF